MGHFHNLSRWTDPETSRISEREAENLSRLRAIALRAFVNAGPDGLTDEALEDIERELGEKQTSVRRRRGELAEAGYLVDTGRTIVPPKGRKERIVWAYWRYVEGASEPDYDFNFSRARKEKQAVDDGPEKVAAMVREFIRKNEVSGPDDPRLQASRLGRLLRDMGNIVGWYQEEK